MTSAAVDCSVQTATQEWLVSWGDMRGGPICTVIPRGCISRRCFPHERIALTHQQKWPNQASDKEQEGEGVDEGIV